MIVEGASDGEIAGWFDSHGKSNSTADITNWSGKIIGVCAEVGIDPETSTLFDCFNAKELVANVPAPIPVRAEPSGAREADSRKMKSPNGGTGFRSKVFHRGSFRLG